MAKRFTDTEKWKKGFLRGLQGPYKLLWLYVLDDCDMAGIWQVDLEVARIRIGEQIDGPTALRLFGDRVKPFDNGKKWFVRDFIFFQYGELKETNRMHLSVIKTLKANHLDFSQGVSEALPRGQDQGQGKGQGYGEGKGGVGEKNLEWFQSLLDERWRIDIQDIHRDKDLDQAIREAYGHLKSSPHRLATTEQGDAKRLVNGWLSKMPAKQTMKKLQGADLTNL